jgi:hypothetical protein
MRRLELYCGAGRGNRCAFQLRDVKLVFPALGTSGSEFLKLMSGSGTSQLARSFSFKNETNVLSVDEL